MNTGPDSDLCPWGKALVLSQAQARYIKGNRCEAGLSQVRKLMSRQIGLSPMRRADHSRDDASGRRGVAASVSGINSGGETTAPMDPEPRPKPRARQSAARVDTIPAVCLCQVSVGWDSTHSRKFFRISYFVYLLLVSFHIHKLKIAGSKIPSTQERLAALKMVFRTSMSPETRADLGTSVGWCLDPETSGCRGGGAGAGGTGTARRVAISLKPRTAA